MNSAVAFVDPPGRPDLSGSVDFPGIAGVGWQGDGNLQINNFGGIQSSCVDFCMTLEVVVTFIYILLLSKQRVLVLP